MIEDLAAMEMRPETSARTQVLRLQKVTPRGIEDRPESSQAARAPLIQELSSTVTVPPLEALLRSMVSQEASTSTAQIYSPSLVSYESEEEEGVSKMDQVD